MLPGLMSGDIYSRMMRTTIAVALFALLLALAAGCGGGDSDATGAATKEGEKSGPTVAVMKPVGDNTASGTITYSKQASGAPLVKVDMEGLEAVSGDTQYVIWQMADRHNMVSIASYFVEGNGRMFEAIEPNPAHLGALESGEKTTMLVTKIPDDDVFRESFGETEDPWDPATIGEQIAKGKFTGPLAGATANE
jgi:hypothetical protein